MEQTAEEILKTYEQCLARIVLQCISELPFDVGPTNLVGILRGSRARFIRENDLNANSMYGVLCQLSKDYLCEVIGSLKEHSLINSRKSEIYDSGEILSISRYGQEFLEGRAAADLELAGDRLTPYQERMNRIRAKHPRAYEPWDEEEEQKLRLMVSERVSVHEIARVLQRKPGAIRSRISKLGLDTVAAPPPPIEPLSVKPRPYEPDRKSRNEPQERRSRICNRPTDEPA